MPKEDAPKQNSDNIDKERLLPVSEKNQRIKNILLEITTGLFGSRKEFIEFRKEITTQFKYLMGKYPDYENRSILHAMIGSSMSKEDFRSEVIEDDFPGDDSVEKFVDSLLKKYGK